MPTAFRVRLITGTAVCLTLITVAFAQKDGRMAPLEGAVPPLAKDGVPRTASIHAGAFTMGADGEALPDNVTQGFGVMSR
ncbi:MAG TPA: hypothetical protein VJU82_01175, partial [Acidobacteriaceae bacterium]|nr:hypothetical protein [Acidobacteriaceae bacterium]